MEPARLTAFLSSLGESPIARAAPRGSDGEPYTIRDGVAHVHVAGVLLPRVPWWMSGGAATSVPRLSEDVAMAVRDPRVRSILLRVSSPGGVVSGVAALADALHVARKAKPLHAHAETVIGSAAYWLGSQAQRLTAEPTAEVGSIGVYRALVDSSRAFEADGLRVHLVRSGPNKGVGHPGVPIEASQLEPYQAVVDGLRDLFVGAIARGRGADRAQIERLATGRTWLAGEAAQLGLLDGVETADAAHAALTVGGGDGLAPAPRANDPARAPALATEIDTMSHSTPAPVAAPAAVEASSTTPPAPAASEAAGPTAADLARDLAAARAEASAANERATAAEAAATALREQLGAISRTRKLEALDRAVADGKVAPAARAAFAALAASQADTDEGVVAFAATLAALPKVTRPEAQGHVPAEQPADDAPSMFSAADLDELRRRGKDPNAIARSNNVVAFLGGGKAQLRDGRIVEAAAYLNPKS